MTRLPGKLTLQETLAKSYVNRTKYNANTAELTLAIASDYNSSGEKLTKSAAGDKYEKIGFQRNFSDYDLNAVDALAQRIALRGVKTLNIAGNSLHTFAQFHQGLTQQEINENIFLLLSRIDAVCRFNDVISGGQTGMDWAGAVAASALGIPVKMTFPNGYRQRDSNGKDFYQFKVQVARKFEWQVGLLMATN